MRTGRASSGSRPVALIRRAELLSRYAAIGLQPPPWAYPLPPSIPFIGRRYGKWGGILVYASAENLAGYERDPRRVPGYLKDDRVLDRHRAAHDQGSDGFFPRVHMAPFSTGSLLVAVWYLIWRLLGEPPGRPRALLEAISAANFCKFSIRGRRNRDYVANPEKLAASLPYLWADLEILAPRMVILPRTIWKHPLVRQAFASALSPAPVTLPIPQFNPQVVNIHLRQHAAQARSVEKAVRGTVLPDWIPHMKGYAKGTPYRFLVEMDDILRQDRFPRPARD